MAHPNRILTPQQAIEHLVECTLATVDDLCMKKAAPACEIRRQTSIAQTGIDSLKQFSTPEELENVQGRVKTVVFEHKGIVQDYTTAMRQKWNPGKPILF